jgi:hypothetical protein
VIRTVHKVFAALAMGFGNIPKDGDQGVLEDCVDVSLLGVLHPILGNSQKGPPPAARPLFWLPKCGPWIEVKAGTYVDGDENI